MIITNYWGVFFSFVVPIILMIYEAYITGLEEGRKQYARINRVQYRENNNGNSYVKRTDSTKHNRNRKKAYWSKRKFGTWTIYEMVGKWSRH